MVETERVSFIFSDARELYQDALEMLDEGRLRNAAEKAWGATKRATDALILARTGEEPRTSGQTVRMLRQLRSQDPSLEPVRLSYGSRQSFLHGLAFYDGVLEPAEDLIRDVRETLDYILHGRREGGQLTHAQHQHPLLRRWRQLDGGPQGAFLNTDSQVHYSDHFVNRKYLREFPDGFAEMVLQTADAYYRDTETGNSIAVKRVQFGGAERDIALAYNVRSNALIFVTIFILKERQQQNRLREGRWVQYEPESQL